MTARPEPAAPVYAINLTGAVTFRLTAYGVLFFYIALAIVASMLDATSTVVSSVALVVAGTISLAVMACTVVLHEGIHGFFMRRYGGHPHYGVGRVGWIFPYAYAASPGSAFTLHQTTIICLAPFVVLSVASLAMLALVPSVSAYAAVAFVTNFAGAVGDLWLVWQVCQFHGCRELLITDTMDGVTVHTPDPAAHQVVARLATSERAGWLRPLVIRWIAATGILLTCVMPFTLLLSVLGSGDVTIGPSAFALVTYRNLPGDGLGLTVDVNSIVVAGLVFALISLLLSRPGNTARRDEVPPEARTPRPAFL